ncbi:crotonase/enoyl-CoA hydratase family protein [Sphingomonas alpina]|uniref:Crotonase/enoyl-CoA hydratase family protein n=1 Tax=Sphingomonas alpina TaxID=653931 RepID=A0A7H0LGC9_9SPHN|nr:crotonase/enoyl-CoA hydratase family protein [Sphingomonas alpina]QNQ08732.1 crotonase/enoyl-CoA hydratase family protein [Sphingomonas alpina]
MPGMTRAFETITLGMDDGIATITLNRPDKLNAFNKAMMEELVGAFDATDADDDVRCVIVTGAGRGFCAGADLSGGAATFDYDKRGGWNGAESPVGADGSVDYSHPAVRDGGGILALRIFASKKPVIGAINGPAVGIGATMTLPMDFRLASDAARFGFVFARRGIVAEASSSWFLPRLVGIGQALEWCYSGRVFGAEEALKGGLVRSLHAPDDLLPAARALAKELTGDSAPVSVSLLRKMMWTGLGMAHPMEAHRIESRAIWSRGASGDAAEGVASFLEKREPVFPDRVSAAWPDFADWFDDPPYR